MPGWYTRVCSGTLRLPHCTGPPSLCATLQPFIFHPQTSNNRPQLVLIALQALLCCRNMHGEAVFAGGANLLATNFNHLPYRRHLGGCAHLNGKMSEKCIRVCVCFHHYCRTIINKKRERPPNRFVRRFVRSFGGLGFSADLCKL